MAFPPLTLRAWLRYSLIRRILGDLEGVHSILEVGAGEGALAVRLAARYDYTGVELDPRSRARAQERLEALGRGRMADGDLSTIEPDARFDVVCAFEVLEHIAEDLDALRRWAHHLRPGGWLLLSVPAHPERFDRSDVRVGHFRRYTKAGLMELLSRTGLVEPAVWSYGFPLDRLLDRVRSVLARREMDEVPLEERTKASGRWLQPPDRLGWATWAATAPFRLLQRPFVSTELGTGWVARARKPR